MLKDPLQVVTVLVVRCLTCLRYKYHSDKHTRPHLASATYSPCLFLIKTQPPESTPRHQTKSNMENSNTTLSTCTGLYSSGRKLKLALDSASSYNTLQPLGLSTHSRFDGCIPFAANLPLCNLITRFLLHTTPTHKLDYFCLQAKLETALLGASYLLYKAKCY